MVRLSQHLQYCRRGNHSLEILTPERFHTSTLRPEFNLNKIPFLSFQHLTDIYEKIYFNLWVIYSSIKIYYWRICITSPTPSVATRALVWPILFILQIADIICSTPNPGLIFANLPDTGDSWSWELLPILVGLLQAAPISGPASPFQS